MSRYVERYQSKIKAVDSGAVSAKGVYVSGATVVHQGYSPFVGSDGCWWVYDDEVNAYYDTKVKAKGDAGASAYEVAVANGFTGTVAEWLLSLHGENAAVYSLPAATASTLGGVKVGDGLSVAEDGTLSAEAQGTDYTLPAATASTLGGVKVGDGLSVADDGTLSADDTSTADKVSYTDSDPALGSSTVQGALDALKTSVSSGKAVVAEAVTDKGVTTASDASFAEIAENIGKIEPSSGGAYTLETLTVTENATYTPDTGHAYSEVTVNVPQTITSETVSNGVMVYHEKTIATTDWDGTTYVFDGTYTSGSYMVYTSVLPKQGTTTNAELIIKHGVNLSAFNTTSSTDTKTDVTTYYYHLTFTCITVPTADVTVAYYAVGA